MEELIQIAFSSLNNRLNKTESQVKILQKKLNKLSILTKQQADIIKVLKSQIEQENEYKNLENSDMEEYKFGE
ncbi:MAG: hypothetical protein IJW82_05950 [Clostridia bacterium]|nr:hypothetical protein [Clostridia bacterium]